MESSASPAGYCVSGKAGFRETAPMRRELAPGERMGRKPLRRFPPHTFLGLGALPHLFEGAHEDLVRLGAEQEKPTVEDEGGNGIDAGLLRLGR